MLLGKNLYPSRNIKSAIIRVGFVVCQDSCTQKKST